MKIKLIILLILVGFITVKFVEHSEPTNRFSAFWDINFIIIYDVDELTDYQIKEYLAHEYRHQLCWDLFGIYPKTVYDHSDRCFVN